VIQAIFGLLGVLVGGAVTFGVEMTLQERRTKELTRQAARLVAFDLRVAGRIVRLAVEQDELWLDQDRPGVPSWGECRAVLAESLDGEGWQTVTTAVMLVSLAATDYERVSPLTERDRSSLGKAAKAADKGCARLDDLTGDKPVR
jgi:hypothetical protein